MLHIALYTPLNVAIATLKPGAFTSCSYARYDKKVGEATIVLPYREHIEQMFELHTMIEFWRLAGNDYILDGGTRYFVVGKRLYSEGDGSQMMEIHAMDAMYLPWGFYNAYLSLNQYTFYENVPADDILKRIVNYNMGTTAVNTARDMSALMTVQTELSQAPSISFGADNGSMLDIANTLCSTVENLSTDPTFMTYDVVYVPGVDKFQLRTYIGQRGNDLTQGGKSGKVPIFGSKFGNIENSSYSIDWSNERNYIFAAGAGVGSVASVQPVENSGRIVKTPYNRRELWLSTGIQADVEKQTKEGEAALRDNRYIEYVEAKALDTVGAIFGVDYYYGDKVLLQDFGKSLTCMVKGFDVNYDENGIEISVSFSVNVD